MGLMEPVMAHYGGLKGILAGLTKSTDHPSSTQRSPWSQLLIRGFIEII